MGGVGTDQSLGRLGVEVELIAPPGTTRADLAEALASGIGGSTERFLQIDAEPSKLEGTALFHNLTPGIRVIDDAGSVVGWVVDDITLQNDLERTAAPVEGWWRLVSDDRRLIDLAARTVDASAPLPQALGALAALFGTEPQPGAGGMWRVVSGDGLPVAIAAPMPGERERAAELVTAPIGKDHVEALGALFDAARGLGFVPAAEGATHLHLDAGPLRDPRTFRRFVQFLSPILQSLHILVGTNPACRRLGPWPGELLPALGAEDWDRLEWSEAVERLSGVEMTKYCDVNLRNVLKPPPGKDTVEFRMLPVMLDAERIVRSAEFFAAVVAWAGADEAAPEPRPDVLLPR